MTAERDRLARTFAVLGIVRLNKSRSTDASVVIGEVDAVAERITRKVIAFVQLCVRHTTVGVD